jgi:hypothetical protein
MSEEPLQLQKFKKSEAENVSKKIKYHLQEFQEQRNLTSSNIQLTSRILQVVVW